MNNFNDLSDEDLEILERLKKDNEKRKLIPEREKTLITNPDKYSSPFAVDDKGKINVTVQEIEDKSKS